MIFLPHYMWAENIINTSYTKIMTMLFCAVERGRYREGEEEQREVRFPHRECHERIRGPAEALRHHQSRPQPRLQGIRHRSRPRLPLGVRLL